MARVLAASQCAAARQAPAGGASGNCTPAGDREMNTVEESSPPLPPLYAICGLEDIPNRRARAFQLLRRAEDGTEKAWSIFVVRWGSQVFGYINLCPHQQVNLDWERQQFLDPNGLRIMCGKHGALFEIGTGRCVAGPCMGQGLQPVAVSVIDGDVCVTGVELVEDDTP
jgi:nitrite reductase/ring-hydroxylating ferredoxin subunit